MTVQEKSLARRTWRSSGVLMALLCLIAIAMVIGQVCGERFSIAQPANGIHVHVPYVQVSGSAEAGTQILYDASYAPDRVVTRADSSGYWSCMWLLSPGKNTIRLHTEGRENHISRTVYYDGGGTPLQEYASLCTGFVF